jgi:hypothetical protein
MLEIEGLLVGVNLSGKEISLIGNTEIADANLSRARITKGTNTFAHRNCNTHGLRLRSLPADSWDKVDSLTVPIEEEFPLALKVREIVRESTGSYGLEFWDFSVETLVSDQGMIEAQWQAKALAWKDKTPGSEFENRPGKRNVNDPATALDLLVERLVVEEIMNQPANNFDGMAALIRAYDLAAWVTGFKVVGVWD